MFFPRPKKSLGHIVRNLVFLKGYDVKGITDPYDMTFRVQSTIQ